MAETKGYIRTSDDKGSVNIWQNVIATIVASAAVEVDGVYALYQSPGRELLDVRGKKGISKGAKITIEENNITVDVFVVVEMGFSVNEVAAVVQKAVSAAVEEAVGIKPKTINITISGVSLKKAQAAVKAKTAAKPTAEKSEKPVAEKPAKTASKTKTAAKSTTSEE